MTPEQEKILFDHKERFLLTALEEIEGKIPSSFEMKQFGRREQREGRPCEELVWWRFKPILHFKWRPSNGQLKVLEIYKTGIPKGPIQDDTKK